MTAATLLSPGEEDIMPATCGCVIQTRNGAPCPAHGFSDELEAAARGLVVAVHTASGVNVAKRKVQTVFDQIKLAKESWKK